MINNTDDNYTILKINEVSKMVGISKPHIYRLISETKFPRPYKIGIRSVGWKLSDIKDWVDTRVKTQPSLEV
jgi:prophage regulatory protein